MQLQEKQYAEVEIVDCSKSGRSMASIFHLQIMYLSATAIRAMLIHIHEQVQLYLC